MAAESHGFISTKVRSLKGVRHTLTSLSLKLTNLLGSSAPFEGSEAVIAPPVPALAVVAKGTPVAFSTALSAFLIVSGDVRER